MLQELIGKTKSQKLLDDIQKQYLELHKKKFPDYKYFTKALSIISVTENNEIKKLGISKVDDLLTDNWGLFLTGFIGGQNVLMTPIDGGIEDYNMAGVGASGNTNSYNTVNNGSGALGGHVRIGSGISAPTRADFKIETPFVGGAESTHVGIGNSGWNSGLGTLDIPAQIASVLGSGVISESGLFLRLHERDGSINSLIMMSHDLISPTVSFSIGQTVNIDYKLVFS